ncbi:PX domain-containing protein kinase-like protein [Liparis tanakae]|uniref:PX domain-containing protein kinase-like protein n=1 Tax=Liparis tanakae TaxID=230148 RepID=A0A4Z2FBP0_9TELE|nr:PX domain-containing protein kinase-like protein [Liparis tanakae]
MSFMEKKSPGRLLLDDTVPLTAVIEASQNLQSHTEYIVRVQRGVSSENSWQVCGIALPLPPKKLLGNMDREFIAERQRGLQAFLDSITQHPLLSGSLPVKKFLDPNNYSANYTGAEHQIQVSMFFRSDLKWEVLEPLKDNGWRIRKKYVLIKNKEQPKERYLLSWVKPTESYLKKYCNPKKSQGLQLQHIKLYGRQILEGLRLLHGSGVFFGHLHASNVIVEDDVCRLVDVENGMLGVPSVLRPAFTQLRKINTTESIDVFGFGHVLYEMTYGRPPDAVPVDQFPDVPDSAVGGYTHTHTYAHTHTHTHAHTHTHVLWTFWS